MKKKGTILAGLSLLLAMVGVGLHKKKQVSE